MRRTAALALLVLPLAASADIAQKPGLWDVTVNLHLDGQEDVPPLPPDVVDQIKALGIEVPFGQPMHQKVCLTPDQVAKNAVPNFNDPDSGCKLKNGQRAGDHFTADMACNGQYQGQGKVEMTLTSAEAYTGRGAFKGTGADGFNVSMTTDFAGRWLDPSCGSVQPYR